MNLDYGLHSACRLSQQPLPIQSVSTKLILACLCQKQPMHLGNLQKAVRSKWQSLHGGEHVIVLVCTRPACQQIAPWKNAQQHNVGGRQLHS